MSETAQLSGVRAEFRDALRAEIDAARASGVNSIRVVDGRRLARIAGHYQYLFRVDALFSRAPTPDSPGELVVPGRANPARINIVSVDGLNITPSSAEDLGQFVGQASLRSDIAFLMERLIDRLEELEGEPNPDGGRILRIPDDTGTPAELAASKATGELDEDQLRAVASAVGRSTTFVWGPPGTGKTRLIGVLGAYLVESDRSLLMVSHTNVAVDQAILSIAEQLADPDVLKSGAVIRIGDPHDQRLAESPELLLETHVERRSEELIARRGTLEDDLERARADATTFQHQIDLAEWVPEARQDLVDMREQTDEVLKMEEDRPESKQEVDLLRETLPDLYQARLAAVECLKFSREEATFSTEIEELANRVEGARSRRAPLEAGLDDQIELLERSEKFHSLGQKAERFPTRDVQRVLVKKTEEELRRGERNVSETAQAIGDAERVLNEVLSIGSLQRVWRRLPTAQAAADNVTKRREELAIAERIKTTADSERIKASSLLDEIVALHKELSELSTAPEVVHQRRVVEDLRQETANLRKERRAADARLEKVRPRQARCRAQIDAFGQKYGESAESLRDRTEVQLDRYTRLSLAIAQLDRDSKQKRRTLDGAVRPRALALLHWGLISTTAQPVELLLAAMSAAHAEASERVKNWDLTEIRGRLAVLGRLILQIEAEIRSIDEALEQVEEQIISAAKVVATTLTRSYLRDSIRQRRFETVVLDEASMAPIPALWVAASLAEESIVVVGDFKQLPPIVISNDEMAQRWLGRDVFEVTGIVRACEERVEIPCLVQLRSQYRMESAISAIPNELMYDGSLRDVDVASRSEDLQAWYRMTWGNDAPVLLVDTESANAWVTSVTRGRTTSRLNFFSAAICVNIAEQLLADDRPKLAAGERPRILIVSPYRAHARLLEILIHDQGIDDEVVAGTAHSFQGSEAGVVILDLVNDEPHWKVGMFMPQNDATTKRLLNVAVTRARSRLIIVGDFAYVKQTAKKAFMGIGFVPFLEERYRKIDAAEAVPDGLAARAEAALTTVSGGAIAAEHARMIMTQSTVMPMLLADIKSARRQLVIYSPFMTSGRLEVVGPALRSAVERGVATYVVTRTRANRGKRELAGYREIERTLNGWGVRVVHKNNMHEKVVFIDREILWSGSLNVLSFRDTQEIMERRQSRVVAGEYAATLCVDDLVAADEANELVCPACEQELELAEGSRDPFYWRCPGKDFTRSIGKPFPIHGLIICGTCGSNVEYGAWGKKPAWRCLENRRHHQNVARTHLLLPKMRNLVPKAELRRLDGIFKIDDYGLQSPLM